ncbi:TIGR04222 domain-containing membrane protein [Streptomyces sp. JJ36]|uniref:TIGR04222 domain-containing membrane protein n=1 Tax=Streptomyces sp. JJ36 TaxID=2736645 RepID=UPI001F1B6E64|nr:TIGR04222 domain-containing membrane protein [Streptomyces sp. JJ36]MCF6526470.1 TIGR04222 domain-containing membrane protein [Streptomyces sp. JJ36]
MWVLFLLLAWAAAGVACARLCLAAASAGRGLAAGPAAGPRGTAAGAAPAVLPAGPLSLYETAFLSGGPHRVADLALVAMSRQRRMLLAHTGWATVVDPEGRDAIERSVIAALGPEGQSRIPPVRAAVTTADAVRALGDRLVSAGLAVPAAVRDRVTAASRQVRGAALLVLVSGLAAEVLAGQAGGGTGAGAGHPVAPWFALPLVLTLGTLAIARFEIRTWTRWASPAGELRLRAAADRGRGERALLTALALRGPGVLPQPELRQALGGARSPLRGQ